MSSFNSLFQFFISRLHFVFFLFEFLLISNHLLLTFLFSFLYSLILFFFSFVIIRSSIAIFFVLISYCLRKSMNTIIPPQCRLNTTVLQIWRWHVLTHGGWYTVKKKRRNSLEIYIAWNTWGQVLSKRLDTLREVPTDFLETYVWH